jgi:hypothetical protein
VRHPEVVDVF